MTNITKGVNTQSDESILALYLREIKKVPLLTREEEDNCARQAANGDPDARNRLAKGNLRFVVNVAKRYQGQGIPLEDLIGEGNVGLLNAIERYDVNKGYHFISYAVWWIKQSVLKAVCEKSRMIRLPMNKVNELIQIERARSFVQGGKTESAEIAHLLNMEQHRVDELINISRDMVSLEAQCNGDNGTTLGDFIEATGYETPEAKSIDNALRDDLLSVIDRLGKKEAAIIRYRYGIGCNRPLSLKEIGERLNLTKERIRQLERKALKRLQHQTTRSVLQDYVA